MKKSAYVMALIISQGWLLSTHAIAAENTDIKLSGSLGVASQGTSKGLGQTDGDPQYTGQIEAAKGGLYGGLKAFNVTTSQGADHEKHFYLGERGKFGDYGYNVFLLYRVQEGAKLGYDNDIYELDVTLSRKINKTTLKGRYIYTPDGFGTAESAYWLEVGASQKINDKFSLQANLATRQTKDAKDYAAWNYGGSYNLSEKLGLDLRYYDTNQHKRGERYEGRTILSLTQKF